MCPHMIPSHKIMPSRQSHVPSHDTLTCPLQLCILYIFYYICRFNSPNELVEGASSSNDTLTFHETPSQRRKRNRPTYSAVDLNQGFVEFSTFATDSGDETGPELTTRYTQVTMPTPQFQTDTIMHNQGVADIEFQN